MTFQMDSTLGETKKLNEGFNVAKENTNVNINEGHREPVSIVPTLGSTDDLIGVVDDDIRTQTTIYKNSTHPHTQTEFNPGGAEPGSLENTNAFNSEYMTATINSNNPKNFVKEIKISRNQPDINKFKTHQIKIQSLYKQ